MAADDLVYVEKGAKAIPRFNGVTKVFVCSQNVLIGTAGMMLYERLEYKADDWIAELIQSQGSANPIPRPDDIAFALQEKARKTFQRIETSPDDGSWQLYKPGEWLVSYVVAGYGSSFHRPYVFELGVRVNDKHQRLIYPPPMRKQTQVLFFGEDQFWVRASNRIDPEYAEWVAILERTKPIILGSFPSIPSSLQKLAASTISFVKVEAQFNSNKVGSGVNVVLIDRHAKKSFAGTF